MLIQNETEIMVSVCSIVYNQDKYLRQCLDGFIMQKTNFKYEILINDDASTDNTADIIREYERKYPGIVRGIFHEENQYSKGVLPERFPFLAARGKYIAMCEGDDYWSDPYKLQKQFDAMEANPQCYMCVHRVRIVTEDGNDTGQFYPGEIIPTGVLSSREFLGIVCAKYAFHTSSYFVVSSKMQEYIENLPTYTYCIEEAGDEKKFLYFGQLGDVYYIDDVLSCRREFSIGSWSVQNRNLDWRKKFYRIRDMGRMISSFDEFTVYRFHDICQRRVDKNLSDQFGILTEQKQYKMLLNSEYKELRKRWSPKFWAIVLLNICIGRGE